MRLGTLEFFFGHIFFLLGFVTGSSRKTRMPHEDSPPALMPPDPTAMNILIKALGL